MNNNHIIKVTLLIFVIGILVVFLKTGFTVAGETKALNNSQLAESIKQHLKSAYPNITVDVQPWKEDKSRLAVFFIEDKFAKLFPQQRYHYIIHSIPEDFFEKYLSNSVWFELTPGESPNDLIYPDENLIQEISPDVMRVLTKAKFFNSLDDLMAPESPSKKELLCYGDFALTKRVLKEKGFKEDGKIDEIFDICHVLMSKGAYCDCEVLYNVSDENRLKARYWKQRANKMGGAQQKH